MLDKNRLSCYNEFDLVIFKENVMKKLISVFLCAVLLASMLGAFTACLEEEAPINYNARKSAAFFPMWENWLGYVYNESGKPLGVFLADASLSYSQKIPYLSYTYDADGLLESITLLLEGKTATLPVTRDDAGNPVSASATVDGKILSAAFTTAGGVITKESYSLGGTLFAEASYGSDAKPLKLVRYEEGEIVSSLDYAVSGSSITVSYVMDEASITSLVEFNADGKPQSISGTASDTEGGTTAFVGTWQYASGLCASYALTAQSDEIETISEYIYTYGGNNCRTKQTVTHETYEAQKLTSKYTEEKDFALDGMLISSTERYYDGAVVSLEEMYKYNKYGVRTETVVTDFDESGRKTYTAEHRYDEKGAETGLAESFFDTNGNKTSLQVTDYTYNAMGKLVKTEQTAYDADNKAQTKSIMEYDAYGNLLLREEIVYLHILGFAQESYTKYDGDGNVIDSGLR